MIVLDLLDLAAGLILRGHPALQATITTTAEAGPHLGAIQGRYQVGLDSSGIEGLAAVETAVDIYQHPLERVQVEARQTVAQGVVAEGARSANPLLQIRVRQIGIQLLEAGKAEDKGVQQGQEDTGRRDFRVLARVRHLAGVEAQVETVVQIGRERVERVGSYFHPKGCKITGPPPVPSFP